MTTMRLLFLNHNLAWRGTFFRAFHFARELVRLGHEVDLWTVSRRFSPLGNQYMRDGVRIWETPRLWKVGRHDGGYAPVDILLRTARIAFSKWDVIQAFDHRPNVSFPWYFKRLLDSDALFCADWCDWWTAGGITTGKRAFSLIDRMEQCLEEGSKRSADFVIATSTVLHSRALSLGIDPKRVEFIPSGSDIEGIPMLDQKTCRQIIGLRPDDPLLCFVGYSLWDIELIADTFTHILKDSPTCQLLVVGGGVESPALEILRQRFRVGEQVYLPGDVPYSLLPKFLGAASVHLLPLADTLANRARGPIKFGDYLASGRPIVTNDIGDSAVIIREKQIGRVSSPSPESFANAVLEVLHLPAEEQHAMAHRARELAEGDLSWKTIVSRLNGIYGNALGGASK